MSTSTTSTDASEAIVPDMGLGMGRAFGAMALFNGAKAEYEAAWEIQDAEEQAKKVEEAHKKYGLLAPPNVFVRRCFNHHQNPMIIILTP